MCLAVLWPATQYVVHPLCMQMELACCTEETFSPLVKVVRMRDKNCMLKTICCGGGKFCIMISLHGNLMREHELK